MNQAFARVTTAPDPDKSGFPGDLQQAPFGRTAGMWISMPLDSQWYLCPSTNPSSYQCHHCGHAELVWLHARLSPWGQWCPAGLAKAPSDKPQHPFSAFLLVPKVGTASVWEVSRPLGSALCQEQGCTLGRGGLLDFSKSFGAVLLLGPHF